AGRTLVRRPGRGRLGDDRAGATRRSPLVDRIELGHEKAAPSARTGGAASEDVGMPENQAGRAIVGALPIELQPPVSQRPAGFEPAPPAYKAKNSQPSHRASHV